MAINSGLIMKKGRKKSAKKKFAAKLQIKHRSKREADKSFLIAIISIVAVVALFLLLLYSNQFVGKAILIPNSAGAELVSPAYKDLPFSLKVMVNSGTAETTAVQFTLKLPSPMDCTYVATTPVKNLIDGWTPQENKCDQGKVIFYGTKGGNILTGKSGQFDIAQIDFSKGLPLTGNPYKFTFELFLALDKGSINQVKVLPESVDVTIQEQPKNAICGNNVKELGEDCDDGNKVTEVCTTYGQSCNVCNDKCGSVTVKGPFCGDGKTDLGNNEQCDDQNEDNGDGCSSTCQVELTALCGDNICNVQFESTSSCPQDCGLVCPTNGLVSWWKGEGNPDDSYKLKYDGAAKGELAYLHGRVGQAFLFDGVDDLVSLGSKKGTIFSDPNSSLSVSFWMRTLATKGPQGSMYIFDTGAGTDGRRGFYCNTIQGTLNCALRQAAAVYKVSASNVIPLNSWKFVTLTFDDAGNALKLYVEGALIKSGTEEKNPGATFESPAAVIGAANTEKLPFNGSLDEIAVWNRALSAAEVKNLYDAGSTGMCSISSFVCGNGIEEPGEECDDGNLVDGDDCSSTCQKESAICGDNVCEIKLESTTSCPQDCGLVCPTNDLVSWWKGENTGAEDSFSGHDGTLGGNANIISGKVGNAFYFDGDGDYLSLGQKPGTIFSDPTGSSLSVSFWMRTNATKSPQGALYILDSGAGTAARRGFYCSTNQGKLDCVIKHADTIYQVSANNAIPLNAWKLVAFTFDNTKSELKLYLDGAYSAVGTKASLSSTSSPVPNSVIGATNLQTLSFNGTLDEVVVWDRVLTAAEIKAIFDTNTLGMCAVPEAVCGNSFIETGEECDDGNQISTDSCSQCKNAICGDGIVKSVSEQCDGSNLAGASCLTLGFVNGSLSCTASCKFNNTACAVAPPPPPPPINVTFTVNGTKISLGEITPANNTFSTLITATESFSKDIVVYTILYNAGGKVLELETDEIEGGMDKDEAFVITADHVSSDVKKKSVIAFDVESSPTVFGKLERTYN